MTDPWVKAVQAYYDHAKSARRSELHGRRDRRFNDRGIHPMSAWAGRVMALEDLYPEYKQARFDPVYIREQAEGDAYEQFLEEVREEAVVSSRASADDNPVTGRVVGTAGAPEEAAA